MNDTSDLSLFAPIAFSLTMAAIQIVWIAVPEVADLLAAMFGVALTVLYASGMIVMLRRRRR